MAFIRDLDNLIPVMTSNTAPSGYVASASSEYSSTYAAWKAFNGTRVDASDCWATANGATAGTLTIQVPSALVVNKYSMVPQAAAWVDTAPKTWTFQGSNNSTDWTTLDTQTNIVGWQEDVKKLFICANTTGYIYYRINITANNGNTSYTAIGELELCATGQYASLIPAMTSNNAPSGVASASEIYSSDYAAWKAFNGMFAASANYWHTLTTSSGWLQYVFPVKKTVKQYTISGHPSSNAVNPKTWSLKASNDGTNWTVLDTRTNITAWQGSTANSYVVDNSISYTHYRLDVTENNGDVRLGIGELRMFGYGDPVHRYKLTENANDSGTADGTVSLLHFDGNINDASGKVWTAYGGATTSTTQSKFGSSSLYLDGIDDYLSTPDSDDFYFGTFPFTIDCWVYWTSASTQVLFQQLTSGDNYVQLALYSSSIALRGYSGSIACEIYNTTPIPLNKWTHLAIVYTGTSGFIFFDGILQSTTITNPQLGFPNIASNTVIGKNLYTNSNFFNGYIDEFRITKGKALWTSNFTPPTAPYAPTAFGPVLNLTNNGGVTFSQDGASFNGTNQWLSGTKTCPPVISVVVWIKPKSIVNQCPWGFDPASGSTDFSVFMNANGTVRQNLGSGVTELYSTSPEFNSTNYPSTKHTMLCSVLAPGNQKVYRDTTQIISGSAAAFGGIDTNFSIGRPGAYAGLYANAYIVDARIYDYALSASEITALAEFGPNNSFVQPLQLTDNFTLKADVLPMSYDRIIMDNGAIRMGINKDGKPYFANLGRSLLTGSSVLPKNIKKTLAAVRENGIDKLYVNGVEEAARLTDDPYTVSLLHFNDNLNDESGKAWTSYGGAITNPAQKKFGGSGMDLVKSSGQYISTPASNDFNFGTADFTIDFWAKWKSHAGTDNLYVFALNNLSNYTLCFWWAGYQGTNKFRCGNLVAGTYLTSDYVLLDGVWNHYAIVRNGNVLTLYIDGVANGTVNCTGISFGDSTSPLQVGAIPGYAYCDIYIDELRISKGIARWTANFTPPTAPYPVTTAIQRTSNPLVIGLSNPLANIEVWSTALAGAELSTSHSGSEPGLLALWKGSEGTGNLLHDSVGNLPAVIQNAKWIEEENTNHTYELQFGAATDSVMAPYISAFQSPSALTGSMEIVAYSAPSTVYLFGGGAASGGMFQFGFDSAGKLRFRDAGAWYTDTSGFVPEKNQRYWIAFTWESGKTVSFYVNGTLMSSVPVSTSVLNPAGIRIGSAYDNTSPFSGRISNVKLFTRVLSINEIRTQINSGVVSKENLVLDMPLDDGYGFGFARDYSRYANHGAITGAQWVLKDRVGLKFNGTSSYAATPARDLSQFTIEVKGAFSNGVTTYRPIVHQWLSSDIKWNMLIETSHNLKFQVYNGSAFNTCDSGLVLADNNTHVGSIAYDGVTIKSYVDGVAGATTSSTLTSTPATSPIYIMRNYNGTYFTNGSLYEVRIWNRALSAAEIAAYKDIELTGNEPGLVFYWKGRISQDGKTAFDETINGSHGVITGAIPTYESAQTAKIVTTKQVVL